MTKSAETFPDFKILKIDFPHDKHPPLPVH